MSSKAALCALLAATAAWAAPPLIDRDGVRNAASQIPGGLPGGGVAPGSLISIRGQGFDRLRAARVIVQAAGRQWMVPATVHSPFELRAVLPSEVAPGFVALSVLAEGRPTNTVAFRVVPSAFGILTDDSLGMGAAVADSVRRGETVTVRGTGLGAGAAARVEVFLGGETSRALGVKRTEGGIDEVRFVVPRDAPRGCHVPLMVRLANSAPGNWSTLSVEADPGRCDQMDRARAMLREEGKAGFVVPLHLTMRYQAAPDDSVDFTGESLIAAFRQGSDTAGVGRLLAVPEPGTCTVYTKSVDLTQVPGQIQSEVLAQLRKLDVGGIRLDSGKQTRSLPPLPAKQNIHHDTIGGEMPDMAQKQPLFLRPGKLRVRTTGAPEMPALDFEVPIPHPVRWSERNRAGEVDRSKGLTLHWDTKGGAQPIAIAGVNIDKPSRAAAAFLCLPERHSTSFHVPKEVLEALPPSRTQFGQSMGFLFVATLPGLDPPLFNEGGLDALLATGLAADGRSIEFR